jgi:peptidylprolyl isomerase
MILPVIITEILEKTVKVDANHPLAGKSLVFELEVVEIA